MKIDLAELREQLRAIKKSKPYGDPELAKEVGIHYQTIRRILYDDCALSPKTIRALKEFIEKHS